MGRVHKCLFAATLHIILLFIAPPPVCTLVPLCHFPLAFGKKVDKVTFTKIQGLIGFTMFSLFVVSAFLTGVKTS